MLIKISAFEMLEKLYRYIKSQFKSSVTCSANKPTRALSASVFPKLGISKLTKSTTSGQDTVRSILRAAYTTS